MLSKSKNAKLFRYQDGIIPNIFILSAIIGGYGIGVAALFSQSVLLNAAGVLVVAQSLIWAAYMVHEFAHGSIFTNKQHNKSVGTFMLWLIGNPYIGFENIRKQHLNHHRLKYDTFAFNYKEFLQERPFLRKVFIALEWAYIPAIDYLMYLSGMVRAWRNAQGPAQKIRLGATICARPALLLLIAWYDVKAVLLYLAADVIFVSVMRFFDAHQHTYAPVFKGETPPPPPDRAYENANTYSNIFSSPFTILNMVALNFSYHNVHHISPYIPWHQLPEAHKQLGSTVDEKELPFFDVVKNYHKHRITRILDIQNHENKQMLSGNVNGVVGASFLY